jgi:uncharacterized protein YjbI with pentapeptide repeats
MWRNINQIRERGSTEPPRRPLIAAPTRPRLTNADLHRANLLQANLLRANLTDARLIDANLIYADMTGADLLRADLGGADLTDVNLTNANLIHADLTGANLTGANLTGASLLHTVFGQVDLTGATGLEACKHRGPSIIDYQTLQQSGQLPLQFLRGVGLPDRFIEYLPSLLERAIQYYSCFISYSSRDQDFADRIHADLQNNGVRCWFAPHDLPIGAKILDGIDAAIRLRDKVLLILSEDAINSDWVGNEVTTAFEEERKRKQTVLFPIRLDNIVMETKEAWAAQLRARNIGDFRHWEDHKRYKTSFDRVLRDLKRAAD